jgi:hypothetical protein
MESDKEIELSVRRVVSDELRRRHGLGAAASGLGTFGLALLFAAFVVAFGYLYWKALADAEAQLEATLDSRLLEFRIVEDLRTRVDAHLREALDAAVTSDDTLAAIDALIDGQTTRAMEAVAPAIDSRVGNLVRVSLSSLPNGTDLLGSIQLPSGAVLAFDRQRCPDGWESYDQGTGRMIVGAGRGNNLSARRVGDTGGMERVTLTLAEIPAHRHANPTVGNNQVIEEVNGLQVGGRGSYGPQHARPTEVAGESQPHENMPPFVALLLCRKI